MSLATRCSACGTMFRVVQDQLRVSEGWVRCGRCDTVFNAHDALVDLEVEAAAVEAAVSAAERVPSDETFYGHPGPREDEVEDGPHRPTALDDDARAEIDRREAPEIDALPDTTGVEPAGALRPGDAVGDRSIPPTADDTGLPLAPAAAAAAPVWRPASDEPALAAVPPARPAPPATPTFVQHADREARWTSPAMRAALIGMTLILAGVLGMQAVYHFRDSVAARSAVADGLLRSACSRWGCRIEPPRHIEQVTLEGSGLSRVPQQPQAVKLAINLRNRGNTDLMMPSVDLSLTDAKGELLARRVLAPADFRIDPPRIRRGAELPLELVLSAGDRAIAGYTVELFYP